ncbi:MAG: NUDIX domain-containing protein [Candidatus Levybacteria bacterium]|nr:NUDIX domain-containing protein [Candidatus Levybacteria bacterium]
MINTSELLFVVDENNQPLTPLPRNVVHSEGHWHRTSHIWVFNSEGQILCQKRSKNKDTNPGFWESFFGGHMPPDSSYADDAQSELSEEIGLQVEKESIFQYIVYKSESSKEFQGVHYIYWNGSLDDLVLEREEIDSVQWFDRVQIEDIITKKTANWSNIGYVKDFLSFIASQAKQSS